MNKDSLDLYWS